MDWLGRLLISAVAVGIVVLGMSISAFADSASSGGCDGGDFFTGCPATTGSSDGSGVDLTGSFDGEQSGSGSGTSGSSSGRPLTDDELLALFDQLCVGDGHCDALGSLSLNARLPVATGANGPAGAAGATVTITDLARFLPAAAALHAEPDGWAVVGVPANFWVDVRAVTVTGSLLGETAQVRFTPEAYRFEYGDGSSRLSGTAGASWAALGQQELTATPTSHTYLERGARSASVTVVYAAEYRFASGPWIPVAGAVSGTTPPQRVLVVVERTALTTPA